MSARPFTPRGEEKLFYDRLLDHELVYQRCDGCRAVVFPLRTICPSCSGEELSLERSAGLGVVHSFTVQHRAAHPSLPVPSTLALADMAEGFRLLASVPDPDGLAVGTPIEVVFDDVEPGLTLLRFRVRADEEGAV